MLSKIYLRVNHKSKYGVVKAAAQTTLSFNLPVFLFVFTNYKKKNNHATCHKMI